MWLLEIRVTSSEEYYVVLGHSVMSNSLRPHSPWNSPSQNTGVGSLSLLQGIFPTQGSNPGIPHCRRILYQLSHKGCPRILQWVVYPFSSGSSWLRNWTRVFCIQADSLPTELSFFTNWAIIIFTPSPLMTSYLNLGMTWGCEHLATHEFLRSDS